MELDRMTLAGVMASAILLGWMIGTMALISILEAGLGALVLALFMSLWTSSNRERVVVFSLTLLLPLGGFVSAELTRPFLRI